MVMQVLDAIDSFLYYPVLLIVMAAAGLYFTIRMGFVQVRMLPEGLRVMKAKPTEGNGTSPFQALMISTASCVGTGNIIGVSTAICLGGAGAAFWMTVMALIGCASSFTECTLAQVYKKKAADGTSYGGPAYYIEDALKSKGFATIFVVFLLLTYSCGFNLLCSYNTQSTFQTYGFYMANPKLAAGIIGAVLALLVGICVMGGGKRIEKTAASALKRPRVSWFRSWASLMWWSPWWSLSCMPAESRRSLAASLPMRSTSAQSSAALRVPAWS